MALASLRSVFQGAEVGDYGLDIRLIELAAKPGHLTFDAFSYPFCDPGIAPGEVVQVRPFVPVRIISVAVRAVLAEQLGASLRFVAQGRSASGRA